MEINIEAYRKLDRLVELLPDDTFEEHFNKFYVKLENGIHTRLSQILKNFENGITPANYKKIWAVAELSNMFISNLSPFKTKPQKISLAKIRKQIKHDKLNNNNLITLTLSSKPVLYFLSRTPTTNRSLMDKTITSSDVRDSVYWFPEIGIILTDVHSDENGELFIDILANQLIGEFEEFRIKSMIVTHHFKNERYINHLVVSAMAQITGFEGMDEIQFIGPDVKKGLGGLYRRQDIRVNLHEIGPNLASENKNIHLRVGNKLRLKRIEGVYDLQYLMYPGLYPSDKQINQLKEELEKRKKIPISEITKNWDLEMTNILFVVSKNIENGKIRGKIENSNIIKI